MHFIHLNQNLMDSIIYIIKGVLLVIAFFIIFRFFSMYNSIESLICYIGSIVCTFIVFLKQKSNE